MGKIYLNDIGYGGVSGPASGDRVYVDQILDYGTHIADVVVNDTVTPMYAPPGAVNDVLTKTSNSGEYTSVVDQVGNANIDLSSLYEGKQNKLIAGENITINQNNDTISASKTNVTVTPAYNSGVDIGSIDVDGTNSTLYIPQSAISGILDVTANNISIVDPNTNIANINNFTGATGSAAGAVGLVPAPASGDTTKYLKSDGSWDTPPNDTYTVFDTTDDGLVPSPTSQETGMYLKGDGTWDTPTDHQYSVFDTNDDGLVPGPASGDTGKYLKADGSWDFPASAGVSDVEVDGTSVVTNNVAQIDLTGKQDALIASTNIQIAADGKTISATDTTYNDFSGTTHGLVPPRIYDADRTKYLKGDGSWGTPDNTTYTDYNGTVHGLVAPPSTSGSGRFLLEDGTWGEPTVTDVTVDNISVVSNGTAAIDLTDKQDKLIAGTNITIAVDGKTISATDTTYGEYAGSTAGLVPEPNVGDTGFLKIDGSWDMPHDTTYNTFTSSTDGLVPHPTGTASDRYLKEDGSWANPTSVGVSDVQVNGVSVVTSGVANITGLQSTLTPGDNIDITGSVISAIDTKYNVFNNNTDGLVPKVNGGTGFLKYDGSWATPQDTTYNDYDGTNHGIIGPPDTSGSGRFLKEDGSWTVPDYVTYPDYNGTGVHGLVAPPTTAGSDRYLKEDGTWGIPAGSGVLDVKIGNNTIVDANHIAQINTFAGSSPGVVPTSTNQDQNKFLKGDGSWSDITVTGITDVKVDNTSVVTNNIANINTFSGATTQDNGTKGLVPAPLIAEKDKYLKGDGSWGEPTGTTYNDYDGLVHGLVPLPTTSGSGRYLKEDGSWDNPPGGVSDVQTKTTSSGSYSTVVVNGVAQVDLSSLYEDKQNKLTAGSNISIDPTTNEISATNTEYNDFSGSAHGLVPQSTSGDQNKFLKGDGSWGTPPTTSIALDDLTDVDLINASDGQVLTYDANSSEWINATPSTGTTVVANPSGTATDSINKIQVNSTIYSIADELDELSDVAISSPTNNQILKYNSTSQKWENTNIPTPAIGLDDLTDVDISTPTNGQVLKYNSTSQKWENGTDNSNISDIQSDNVTIVDSNHIAHIDTMVGATSQNNGTKGLVPAPTTSDAGKYLKSDGTWDNEVEANPSGTATATLSKIKVENTIYDISGGGGGGGSVLAISKSDYDNLSTADKNNGTVYMVTTPAHGDQGILSLLHFDSLKDEAEDIIWTPLGLANISDKQSKFGNSSLLLDKFYSVGIYSSATDKFDFADNDWTIDAWIYPVAVDRYALFSIAPVNYGDCRLGVDLFYGNGSANEWAGSSGYSWDLVQSDGSQGQGSISLLTNVWQHIAYVREGNLLTLYVDGQQAVQNDIGNASIYHGETDVLKIGVWGDNGLGFNGYIDEFCVRNYAAWSAAFSPPSSPYEIYQPESYSIYYMSKKFS